MITRLGARVLAGLQDMLYGMGFFWLVLRETFALTSKRGAGWKVVVMQVLFTGVDALAIVVLIALSLGTAIIIEGSQLFSLGSSSLLYTILVAVVTRELGPVLIAFIVMARSGVAIATELSNMVINQEIEAYLAVGVNPISYLVVPRFMGAMISMATLTVLFSLAGLAGAWLVSQWIQPIPAAEYFANLLSHLTVADLAFSLLKAVVFGAIIAVVSSYQGFRATKSSTEVPILVIRAVGQGFSLIIVANIIITVVSIL